MMHRLFLYCSLIFQYFPMFYFCPSPVCFILFRVPFGGRWWSIDRLSLVVTKSYTPKMFWALGGVLQEESHSGFTFWQPSWGTSEQHGWARPLVSLCFFDILREYWWTMRFAHCTHFHTMSLTSCHSWLLVAWGFVRTFCSLSTMAPRPAAVRLWLCCDDVRCHHLWPGDLVTAVTCSCDLVLWVIARSHVEGTPQRVAASAHKVKTGDLTQLFCFLFNLWTEHAGFWRC